MSNPQVSVITPLYNSTRFIETTLETLRTQTFEDWESILVDDGSTDDTAERVKPFLQDARFRYVKQANQGIAGARNTALRLARGEWVCLLDHDDRWLPEKLEKQLRFAGEKKCDIVATDAYVVKNEARQLYSNLYDPDYIAQVRRIPVDPQVDVFGLLIHRNFLCASSVMIRKRFFDELGLLSCAAAPADDYEMWLRCMPEARIGYLPEPLIEYVLHENNFSRNHFKMLEQMIYVLDKTSRRHEADPLRRKQFGDEVIHLYQALLAGAFSQRRYSIASRQVLRLLGQGRRGWRLLYWTADRQTLKNLLNSLTGQVQEAL